MPFIPASDGSRDNSLSLGMPQTSRYRTTHRDDAFLTQIITVIPFIYVKRKQHFYFELVGGVLYCKFIAQLIIIIIIIITIINPLTARVVGAPQMILQPVSPFFPVLHCPLGLADLQACPFPDVVFPPLPLSALSSSPFHCALQDGFGQT